MEAVKWGRQAVGPAIVGIGVWFALGDLTVASPDSADVRLGAPAPWFWLPLVAVAASLVGPWRRRPGLAAPALLPLLPWLPLPLPAVALLWSGPLAWLPVILALVAAWWSRPPSGAWRAVDHLSPRVSAAAAGGVTLAALVAVAVVLDPRLPGGDEPHYLIITQSLIEDGDLRIENNHAARQYAPYFGGTLRPDFIQRGQDGQIYSIHAPGASVLVLPAFAVLGYHGAQLTILLLSALAGALLWRAGWHLTGDRAAAWFATLAVVATPTFLIQGVTIFPDGPGAFVVAAGVVLLLRLARSDEEVSAPALAGASALVAFLPWLHTRFSVLAAGIGLAAGWLIATDARRPVGARAGRLAAFLAVPFVSATGWFLHFWWIYGTPNPTAPYGTDRSTSLAFVPGGLTALFADAQFGLLVYSPVLLVGLAALVLRAAAPSRWLVAGVVGIGLANMAAAATYWMWWAGVPAPPARFAAAALPVFAVPLALAWRHGSPALRSVASVLLVISIGTSILLFGVGRGALAWNVRGVRAAWLDWLNGVVDLSRGWPSFFWQLTPADLSTQLHFATHVLVWAGILVAIVAAHVHLPRSGRTAKRGAISAVWCVPLALMLVVQAGWWVNDSSGLNATRSQIAVLGRAAAGDRVYQIGPGAVARRRSVHDGLRVRATRADPVGEPGAAWLPLLDLPPGRYTARASTRQSGRGVLALRLGRSVLPLATHEASGGTAAFPFALPAGAAAVVIEPDEAFANAADTIEIAAESLGPLAAERATAWARYGDADVYFLENASVFVENDGFWVRGGNAADLVVAAPPGRRAVTLHVSNGALANQVTLVVDGTGDPVGLSPWESRPWTVPVGVSGVVSVRVASAGGFRPSETGPSQDGRYLGVRVTVSP